uniref:Uncharacterized protein n=1 Tax=viral metagenome TaxID=1070528 RepID=A0A6M3KUZ8_9ZZZZ
MGGAYTAEPGPAATQSKPTGWNDNWAHGSDYPDPPGYDLDEDDYLLLLEVGNPGYVTLAEPSCYVVAKIYEDEGDFESVNISNNSYITWYAAIDGERIPMSVNGGAWDYEPSTIASYLFGYGTFGSNSEITFGIIEDDEGKNIIVDAIATIIRENDSAADAVEVLADDTVSIPIRANYKLILTIGDPSEIDVDDPYCFVTGKVYKQDDSVLADGEILASSLIWWTATVDGGAISVVPSSQALGFLGDTYGVEPNMRFDVSEDDVDKSAVVNATVIIETEDGEETIEAEGIISIPIVGDDPITSFTVTLTIDSVTQTGYTPWYTDIKLQVRRGSSSLYRDQGVIIFNPKEDYAFETISEVAYGSAGGPGAGTTITISPDDPSARVVQAIHASPEAGWSYYIWWKIGENHSVTDFSFDVTLSYAVTHESGAITTNSYTHTYTSGVNTESGFFVIDTGIVSDTF